MRKEVYIIGGVLLLGLFTKPVVLGAAAAAAGLLVAALCATVFWVRRRRQVLGRLRRYGRVEFTSQEAVWSGDSRLDQTLPFRLFIIAPLVIGGVVFAVVVEFMAQWGFFEYHFPFSLYHLDAESIWIAAWAGGCGIFFGAGYFLLRWWREEREIDLRRASSLEWERTGRAAAPRLAELEAISREITELSASLDLKLDYDYAAGANMVFGEVAKQYPGRSDAEVVRATLAICHKRLIQSKQECAEDVALYWEAIAAIAEADVAAARAGAPAGELLPRLGDLKERLFAPSLLALLSKKSWWVREKAGAGDYRNIAGAIIREAQAVTADAQGGEGAGKPAAAFFRGDMEAAEAYAVLGADPAAGGEEIARLGARLLEAWAGDDAEAKGRRQELQNAAALLKRKTGGGHG